MSTIVERSNPKAAHALSHVFQPPSNRAIERSFNELMQFKRIAIPYEKSAANYLTRITLITTPIWLRAS